MKDFIKRNVKFVVTIGVSLLIVAGLTTALIVTNTGYASAGNRDRSRSRDRDHVRVEMTEEQIEQRLDHARERLAQKLADGRITQEEHDERLAAIESGEYQPSGRDRGSRRGDRTRDSERDPSEEKSNRSSRADKNEDVAQVQPENSTP